MIHGIQKNLLAVVGHDVLHSSLVDILKTELARRSGSRRRLTRSKVSCRQTAQHMRGGAGGGEWLGQQATQVAERSAVAEMAKPSVPFEAYRAWSALEEIRTIVGNLASHPIQRRRCAEGVQSGAREGVDLRGTGVIQ